MKIEESTGIDVSKETIDAHLYCKNEHKVFTNDNNGFKDLLKWIIKMSGKEIKQVIICFEHTGLYSLPLATYLSCQNIFFCMVSGLEIKRSIGIIRGKNDRVDSYRIAEYAYLRREKLECYCLPSKQILHLQKILALRERMVIQRGGYVGKLKEYKRVLSKKDNEVLFKVQEQLIDQFTNQIIKLEKEIKSIIENDEELSRLYNLVTSVKGVGMILAANLLVTTNCFTRFDNSRQYACYAGIAPFEFQSGISIQGKTKVNHLANKKIKSLLNMSALASINWDPEIKQYYQNRINAGKNKMSTLNIIRNKIVGRVFAVVKRGTPFVSLYQHAA